MKTYRFSSIISCSALTSTTMMRLFLLLSLMVFAVKGEQITAIATGTGFSSCTGYCYTSVYINASKITTSQTSKLNPSEYPEIQQEYSIDSSEFDDLVELVGNIQSWKAVDSPIGCPDCNNQGLEWIDIYTDEQPKYGVTFEYQQTIPDYGSLVDRVRTIREQYFSSE